MTENDIAYYRIIGRISAHIGKSETFEEAVTGSLRLLLEGGMADYAVVYYENRERTALRPAYWVCPLDLTSLSAVAGEGAVGKTYATGERRVAGTEDGDLAPFASLGVTSAVCLPLGKDGTVYGCVVFLRAGDVPFGDDDVSVFEMLTMMTEMQLEADAPAPAEMETKNVLLSVRGVHKSFQNGDGVSHVLRGIDFNVYEGEILCLLGESGCGKSTVLNLLGGLLTPEEGEILFDGKDVAKFTGKELTRYRREYVGFVFQAYHLMPNLTVKQNLDLIGELVKDPADSGELLSLVGLADKADRYPAMLSGGQQQRVAIARAMIKRPRLILADEPTAALDYETSIGVLSVMENVVARGASLVIVTHNEEIAKMANRVIRLRGGKTYETRVNRRPLHAAELSW